MQLGTLSTSDTQRVTRPASDMRRVPVSATTMASPPLTTQPTLLPVCSEPDSSLAAAYCGRLPGPLREAAKQLARSLQSPETTGKATPAHTLYEDEFSARRTLSLFIRRTTELAPCEFEFVKALKACIADPKKPLDFQRIAQLIRDSPVKTGYLRYSRAHVMR